MKNARDMLGVLDRARIQSGATADVERFKEWYHFHLMDPESRTDVIANLSYCGNISKEGGGRAEIILLIHQPKIGWLGEIDRYDGTTLSLESQSLVVEVGNAASLANRHGLYELSITRRDTSCALKARLAPCTDPLLLRHDTPLGQGTIKWLIVPFLKTSLSLTVDGKTADYPRACSYHDHNWGFWKWGEDFGWEWGFGTDTLTAEEHTRASIVFDRTTDRLGAVSRQQTVALWRGSNLEKIFTSEMLRSERSGRFDGPIPVKPGVTALIGQGRVQTVPSRLRVSARDQSDWLDLEYQVDAAVQIRIPSEFGFGFVGLNETLGRLSASGSVSGREIGFETRAAFEFLG